MEFSDVLRALRKAKRLKQAELAGALDVSLGSVAMWETASRKPPAEMLIKIANYFGVTVDYLLGSQSVRFQNEDVVSLPVLASVAAGFDRAIKDNEDEFQEVPRSILKNKQPGDFIVFLVKGDSMSPKLLDGDRVLVQRMASVDSGSIAVVCYDDYEDGTVKKIHYEHGCDYVDLIPLNAKYNPVRIQREDLKGVRVVGKVVYLFRSM